MPLSLSNSLGLNARRHPAGGATCTMVDEKTGNVAGGTAYDHNADAVLGIDVDTLPSSGSIIIVFRSLNIATNNDEWRILLSSAGAVFLRERVSGSDTLRGAAGAGTISNGDRLAWTLNGTTITIYVNNVQAVQYGSASNFSSAVLGEINDLGTGGAISDLQSRAYSAECLTAEGVAA